MNARGSKEELLKDYLQFIIDWSCYMGGGGGAESAHRLVLPSAVLKG